VKRGWGDLGSRLYRIMELERRNTCGKGRKWDETTKVKKELRQDGGLSEGRRGKGRSRKGFLSQANYDASRGGKGKRESWSPSLIWIGENRGRSSAEI